jgi:hypothetical protein
MPVQYHLPFHARNPEKCRQPETCRLDVHVDTPEEAEGLRARRDTAARSLGPAYNKADLPMLRESLRTGVSVFDLIARKDR